MKKIVNKIAVITGGDVGVGLSAAKLFADEGAKIAIIGFHPLSVRDALKVVGNGSAGLVSDITNADWIGDAYESITTKLGAMIDILVISADAFQAPGLADCAEDLFDRANNSNFKGLFFAVQGALPFLNDGASVVLIPAPSHVEGLVSTKIYAASNAAVRSLAKSFSFELQNRGIRVNILSQDTSSKAEEIPEAFKKEIDRIVSYFSKTKSSQQHDRGQDGVAAACLYLASEDSCFLNGSEFTVDREVNAGSPGQINSK